MTRYDYIIQTLGTYENMTHHAVMVPDPIGDYVRHEVPQALEDALKVLIKSVEAHDFSIGSDIYPAVAAARAALAFSEKEGT